MVGVKPIKECNSKSYGPLPLIPVYTKHQTTGYVWSQRYEVRNLKSEVMSEVVHWGLHLLLSIAVFLSKLLLTFPTLWAISADDKLIIFFSYFSQKTGVGIPCKLSPLGTICMNCQNLFSGKNNKNISKSHLLKILPRVLWVKFSQSAVFL